jgi:AraC-like DNA-binding protein
MSTVYPSPHLIASWATAVAQALESDDCDSKALFARAGIDLTTTLDPRNRIQADRMTVVYDLIEKTADDPAFGLRIAGYVHPTTFHALGYSLFASRTMESFCLRLVRYFRLVSTNAVVEFEQTSSESRLYMSPAIDKDSYIPQDAWLATVLKIARDIYRPDFSPLRVCLRRPNPGAVAARQFTDFFRAPVDFGCNRNKLVFDTADMGVQLPAANAELARQNDGVVMNLLAQMDRSDILTQVRASFVELLPSGECSKDKVADRLNMSERTLQNKLADRSTTYRDLLNEIRQELAEQYMSQGVHSVSEVAYLVGFAEISSFSRAFRAWTGQSPSDFRKRYLKVS